MSLAALATGRGLSKWLPVAEGVSRRWIACRQPSPAGVSRNGFRWLKEPRGGGYLSPALAGRGFSKWLPVAEGASRRWLPVASPRRPRRILFLECAARADRDLSGQDRTRLVRTLFGARTWTACTRYLIPDT